ncbi:glycosyltransferase family 8 protein [Aliiroseovarius sp.]|uniref:glycosyltransferase family 8 protein n=1 Tax=Aliiroseovarius sp. TaxID=1872442 RepID=UPI003BA90860
MTETSATPHVSYVFDGGFALPTMVSVFSLLQHRPKDVEVQFFVTEDVPKMRATVEKLQALFPGAEIKTTVMTLPDTLSRDFIGYPVAGFARLLLPDYLDKRTIYLDGDTWVRDDIGELYDQNLDGRVLGACLDAAFLKLLWRSKRNPKLKHRRLVEMRAVDAIAPSEGYFNAGMMVVDIPALREQGLIEDFTNITRATTFWSDNGLLYHDQSYLNTVFGAHTKRLDPQWNAIWANRSASHKAIPAELRAKFAASQADPAILHMTSKPKPWIKPVLRGGRFVWGQKYRKVLAEFRERVGADAWAQLST